MISIITLSFPASLPLLPKANNSIYDDDYYYYQNLIIVVKIFSRKDVACMFDVARYAGCSLTKKNCRTQNRTATLHHNGNRIHLSTSLRN